jgi:hypothetical protein
MDSGELNVRLRRIRHAVSVAIRLHQRRCGSPALNRDLPGPDSAAAIRKAYLESGELSAAIELRRLFPGITDNEKARACARTIAGWQPLPVKPAREPPVSRRA